MWLGQKTGHNRPCRVVRAIVRLSKRQIVFAVIRNDDAIHQDTRHANAIGRCWLIQQSLHLSKYLATTVVDGLRDRQDFAQHRLFIHHKIAKRIGSRCADETDVNRKRLVQQPRFA